MNKHLKKGAKGINQSDTPIDGILSSHLTTFGDNDNSMNKSTRSL